MNLKMSFLAAFSVALFSVSANAEIIHESDFEAEPTVGFGIGVETMLFNDCGGDLIGFSANGNPLNTGDSMGIVTSNPNSGSFAYAVDVGITTDTGGPAPNTGAGNGWGAAWCGANSTNGSGGFNRPDVVIAEGNGCYVDLQAGTTLTATCQVATDPANPLTGGATAEIRLEFNNEVFDADGNQTSFTPDLIPRAVSTRLGATQLTGTYQELSISYTLTQADIDTGLNSIAAVMAVDGAGFNGGTGLILFDDFVYEVDDASVVLVGAGHATTALKGDVDLSGVIDFADIPAFISVLQAGSFQAEADCDCNEVVDFADIPAFIAILQGG